MAGHHPHAPRFLLRHKFLFGLLGAILLILLGASVGFAVLLSGAFSTAATKQHARPTHRILDAGLRYSVNSYSEDIQVPNLESEALIARGGECFDAHCVECHGGPGIAPRPFALGMMPVPSNLAQASREWRVASLYYITKKGVRMTGMPAWEFRLADRDLWAIAAFLEKLPSVSRDRYLALRGGAGPEACRMDSEEVVPPTPTEVLLLQYACHSCHQIEGVVGPMSEVGPRLIDWPQRRYIAGTLPNTPENLTRWIMAPREVSPRTLMPDLGVPESHARQIAQYLFAQE